MHPIEANRRTDLLGLCAGWGRGAGLYSRSFLFLPSLFLPFLRPFPDGASHTHLIFLLCHGGVWAVGCEDSEIQTVGCGQTGVAGGAAGILALSLSPGGAGPGAIVSHAEKLSAEDLSPCVSPGSVVWEAEEVAQRTGPLSPARPCELSGGEPGELPPGPAQLHRGRPARGLTQKGVKASGRCSSSPDGGQSPWPDPCRPGAA